jgi:hypothetical protein
MITASRTNCGGNSAALAACKQFAILARLVAIDEKTEFKFSELDELDRADMARWVNDQWLGGAGLFVRTNFIIPREGRVLANVCEKPFDNIPQPTVWNFYHKNPDYAVGYSDGSTGLISPLEFAALDLKGFTPLSELATNGAAQVTQP